VATGPRNALTASLRRRGSLRRGLGRAGVLFALGLVGSAVLAACTARGSSPIVEIAIHYSHFDPATVSVPVGVPVTFVIDNTDPIDHEWIVGDAAGHQRHRTGTEPAHEERPTEVSITAGTTRTTVVTFETTGTFAFICHLPGHEAYGMAGTVEVVSGRG